MCRLLQSDLIALFPSYINFNDRKALASLTCSVIRTVNHQLLMA